MAVCVVMAAVEPVTVVMACAPISILSISISYNINMHMRFHLLPFSSFFATSLCLSLPLIRCACMFSCRFFQTLFIHIVFTCLLFIGFISICFCPISACTFIWFSWNEMSTQHSLHMLHSMRYTTSSAVLQRGFPYKHFFIKKILILNRFFCCCCSAATSRIQNVFRICIQ